MKILLVHAYFLDLDEAERKVMKPYPPLGVLYLCAYLKQHGHEVAVFDGTFQSPGDFKPMVDRFAPRVVGFYANMMTRHNVLRLRAQIEDPAIRIVAGGPDPPHYAEDYLDRGFDAVVVGEGEPTMSQWLQHLDEPDKWDAIEGLVFRRDGATRHTPSRQPRAPLDDYPLPDRAAIDLNAYLDCWEKHHGMRPMSLITSRGCPYRCTWCSHTVYGHSLRKRSPENVLGEIQAMHEHYRFDHYWFADDVFTIQIPWVFRFRDLMKEHPDLIRPFETISRADRLTPEVVAALADLRCFRLWVGAESGSQRLLDNMKRGVTRGQVQAAVTMLRDAGIQTGMFFMWGFRGEAFGDVLDTVSLAAACRPETVLTTIAYPIKGTAFYHELATAGIIGATPAFDTGTDRDTAILGQPGRDLYAIATLTSSLQIDGHRADLVILKAARAHAAFEGRTKINQHDILLATELAIPHRLKRGPFADAQMSMSALGDQLDQVMSEWGEGDEAAEDSAQEGEEQAAKKKASP